MNTEVRNPRKPFTFYLLLVVTLLFVFNTLVMPFIAGQRVETVDYAQFMDMTLQGNVGQVMIEDYQILFTDKAEKKFYRTGVVDDPGLTERLHANGAKFGAEIQEETSPLLAFFLSWVLPLAVFGGFGWLMMRMMTKRMGSGSMSFGMGNSKAKVYVKSSAGIMFDDVEGVDEAEENLAEYKACPADNTCDLLKGLAALARGNGAAAAERFTRAAQVSRSVYIRERPPWCRRR